MISWMTRCASATDRASESRLAASVLRRAAHIQDPGFWASRRWTRSDGEQRELGDHLKVGVALDQVLATTARGFYRHRALGASSPARNSPPRAASSASQSEPTSSRLCRLLGRRDGARCRGTPRPTRAGRPCPGAVDAGRAGRPAVGDLLGSRSASPTQRRALLGWKHHPHAARADRGRAWARVPGA